MIWIAKELRAHFDAGLLLTGQDEYGELEWMGNGENLKKLDQILSDEDHYKPLPF